MKRKCNISSIFMISAVLGIGVFFLLFGVIAYFSDMYPNDIYISEQIQLYTANEVENQYLIKGSLCNRGEETITIQSMEFWCYNADRTVHGSHTIENISIEPGENYAIYEEITSNGSVIYTSVSLHSTIIEDGEVMLQYSADGKNFGNKQNEITSVIVGAIMTPIGIYLLVRRIKQRRLGNGK